MRVNIYSQELTNEIHLLYKISDIGIKYPAIRFMLHSSEHLHFVPGMDDDRSAVTFWLPKSFERREALAKVFETAAHYVRSASPETGSN